MAPKAKAHPPVNVLIRLQPALWRKAKLRAVEERRPLSELFREALAQYLEEARAS